MEQTILLHGKLTAPWFGEPDWHGFLPEFNLPLETEPPEKELPGLAQLTDAEQSRVFMERVLRENGHFAADQTITACTPRILSYKPGSRCTIRYELEYSAPPDPSTHSPQAIIGKVYRKGSKAQNAYKGMMTLWHSPLADGSTHGTFNPEQVLIDGERIGFIDFDDYCMAEPALDVGLFRSAIKDTGMNAPFSSSASSRAERLPGLPC